MVKLGFLSLVAAFVGTLAVVNVLPEASAGKPCARTKFDTTQLAEACKKGGQDEAKKQMKAYLKLAKKKKPDMGCPTCHSKVGGNYPLKADGLKLYKEYGGT